MSTEQQAKKARGAVLLAMLAEGKLNDETLPAERMAIFKAKPFREWPKEMQEALAPFGAAMID